MRFGGDIMRTETTTFTGPFAKSIQKYLEEKQIMGNKIESYVYHLKSFYTLCFHIF